MQESRKTGLQNPTNRARLRGTGKTIGLPGHSFSDKRKLQSAVNIPTASRPLTLPLQPTATTTVLAHQENNSNKAPSGKIQDIQPAIKRGKPANVPIKTPELLVEPLHVPKLTKSKVLIRQSTQSSYKAYPKHRRPLKPMLLTGVAIVVFIIGLSGVFISVKTTRSVNAQVKKTTSLTASSLSAVKGVTSEDNSSNAVASYRVAKDMARLLIIDKINVNARVSQVGAEQKDNFAAPDNIFNAGWYNRSVKPGEQGVVVLTGQVYGPTKPGIFSNLGNVLVGDKLRIERGDGKLFVYTVKEVETYENDKVDVNKVLTPAQPGKPGLNLLSSSSRFNIRTNRFEKRMAVFAVQD